MALIVSATSGNFNVAGTWVGGVVPGAADEAQAATGHVVTITANVTCTEISNAGTGKFIINNGVTLTANVTSKTTTTTGVNCLEFSASSPATASIVGNVTGGTVNTARGVANLSNGTLTITGNCTGGSGNNSSYAVLNNSTGIVNVTGNCIGGSNNICKSVVNNSTGQVNITGNCTGGTATNCEGAFNNSTGTLSVIGTIQSTQSSSGVAGTNVQQVTILSGPFLTEVVRGVAPVYCAAWRWNASPSNSTYLEVMTNNLLAKRNLYTADNITGMPAASNVKSGIVYGPANELTGTFEQTVSPSIAGIAAGVWDYALSSITTSSTIGKLLKDNVDATISSRSTATTAGIADAVWDELLDDHTTNGSFGARIVRSLNSNNTLQLTGSHHAAADVHEFQSEVIADYAFAPSAVTLFTDAVRTELATELTAITELHLIHGLKNGSTLTVTPTSRSAGSISQTIGGDGTNSTTVSRD